MNKPTLPKFQVQIDVCWGRYIFTMEAASERDAKENAISAWQDLRSDKIQAQENDIEILSVTRCTEPRLSPYPRKLAVLDISTAHLKPETATLLDKAPLDQWPVAGGKTQYGYYIYAHDENDGSIPPELWECCRFARKHGCEYLYFDRDADTYKELASFDW